MHCLFVPLIFSSMSMQNAQAFSAAMFSVVQPVVIPPPKGPTGAAAAAAAGPYRLLSLSKVMGRQATMHVEVRHTLYLAVVVMGH